MRVVDLLLTKLREYRLKKGHNHTHYLLIKILELTQLEITKKDRLLNYSLPLYIKVILDGCLEYPTVQVVITD